MSASPSRPALRAPIVRTTLVRSGREHTFDVFVATLGQWWPLQPYSLGQERVVDVTVERRLGGRVYETWDDGTTADWGELLAWDPPAGFTMTWTATPAATEVELSFAELTPALTRVRVEHRGWERLSDEQFAVATRAAGGYARGWEQILGALTGACEDRNP